MGEIGEWGCVVDQTQIKSKSTKSKYDPPISACSALAVSPMARVKAHCRGTQMHSDHACQYRISIIPCIP